MPTTFSIAGEDVLELLAEAMQRFHPDLHAAGVKVAVLLALNPNGPAVKRNGYAVLAQIKIISPEDRVTKPHDAEIKIDERLWEGLREGQKLATLDHELCHVQLAECGRTHLVDARGEPTGETEFWWKKDDLSRPLLTSVTGDWSAGDGFAAVCERHGADAIEYENLARCRGYADEARRAGERERGGP